MDKDNYTKRLHDFIDYAEDREPNSIVIPDENITMGGDTSTLKSLISSIIEIFNTIKNFLKI